MDTLNDLLNRYSKSDGTDKLRDDITAAYESDGIDVIHQVDDQIPFDYRKETGTISSFLVILVSGGEVREENYLSELTKKQTFPRIKLFFVSSEKEKGGLSPKMMLSKLDEIIEREDSDKTHKILYSSIDHIFMVSDVDHYYIDLVEVLRQNNDSKVTWIISNPCFEIWLYYAHFSEIVQEIRELENIPQSKQSSTLKSINNQIVKGGIDPRKAFDKIQIANENSRKNFNIDENGIPVLFATNMYMLGEYILDIIGKQEFEDWLSEKQNKIEAYKNKYLK